VLKEKQIGFLVKLFACKNVCVNLVKSRGFLFGHTKEEIEGSYFCT
jgi:hypothetical protein